MWQTGSIDEWLLVAFLPRRRDDVPAAACCHASGTGTTADVGPMLRVLRGRPNEQQCILARRAP
jgi:hypothetical protein